MSVLRAPYRPSLFPLPRAPASIDKIPPTHRIKRRCLHLLVGQSFVPRPESELHPRGEQRRRCRQTNIYPAARRKLSHNFLRPPFAMFAAAGLSEVRPVSSTAIRTGCCVAAGIFERLRTREASRSEPEVNGPRSIGLSLSPFPRSIFLHRAFANASETPQAVAV